MNPTISSMPLRIIHSQSDVAQKWMKHFSSKLSGAFEAEGTVIFSPFLKEDGFTFDWARCEEVFADLKQQTLKRLVLVSSAAVYGTGHRHPRWVNEARIDARKVDDFYSQQWRRFEAEAQALVTSIPSVSLITLRPCLTLIKGGDDWFNRALQRRVWFLPFGYDAPVQLLGETDFLNALQVAIESKETGSFNVAPRRAIQWSSIARFAGIRVLPGLHVAGFSGAKFLRPKQSFPVPEIANYVAHCWTADPGQFSKNFAYEVKRSSRDALVKFLKIKSKAVQHDADPFGLNVPFITNRFWHRWATRYYWRFDVQGLEHLPKSGKGILFGPHRGFMPFDGAMLVYWLTTRLKRTPRFLVHTCLLKMPVLTRYIANLGGIPACQENANWVLDQNELLAVFPEGIQATFTEFNKGYELASFGRSDFIKWALRNQAPLCPFVIVGTVETYPILYKINWRWWKKTFEWPAFPLTPTFPWCPLPLPTKWHVEFLPPINLHEQYPPEAADDYETVRKISDEIKSQLQTAWDDLRARRKGWFR